MVTTIVATEFGGPEVLSVIKDPQRPPGRGEVTVRVEAAAVNPIDYKLYSGAMGNDPASLPLRLGQELAGVVTAAGTEPIGPAGPIGIGDEVMVYQRDCPGAYASEVTVAASAAVPKPALLDWRQASGLLLSGATAVHALAATGAVEGDTVLIHGVSGPTGLATAQIAISRGARVIGTAGAARHERLRGYGIDPVAYGPGLAERVRQRAPGGVDLAIDAAGTDEAIEVSVMLVPDKTRIATLVAIDQGAEVGIKRLGSAAGASDRGTEIRSHAWSELVSLAARGKLEVTVARTFPLTEAAAAHELVATGHAGGKVVLLP